MAARDHSYHQDHHDEKVRTTARTRELALARRRLTILAQQPHEYRDIYGQPTANQDVAQEGAW